ncbi:hypothetical protein CTAYLR_007994 [Chrysophaeum taylorii]|uniref:Sugar phosphate transporter domain-containing protein n=1 Tax=Chrysophaeum taylorii TaxID=2483200 RepID=A0AAD7XIA6_9STRA|nr:hypothetical protein CTAYLR_007994 [Chrysophaeum taylorii]
MGGSRRGREGVELILLVVAWYGSSVLAITTSKMCMQMAEVPLLLCACQFLTATCGSWSMLSASNGALRLTRNSETRAVAKTAAAYAMGFLLTNLAFAMAAASFVETVKAGEPVSTAALAASWLGERESVATYLSLAPIVLGIALATATEDTAPVLSLATLVTLGSNVCFSLRAVFVKQLKQSCPSSAPAKSAVVLFYHVSRFGFPVFIVCAFLRGDPARVIEAPGISLPFFVAALFANGLGYSAYNLASFMVLNRVSTTTHAVLNVCRRVVVIAVTTLYFRTPLSLAGAAGILIAAAGVFLYANAKT